MSCAQPGCSGTIVDGYCDVCGMAARKPASAATAAPSAAVSGASALTTGGDSLTTTAAGSRRQRGGTTRTRGDRRRLGAGLVEVPAVPSHDPAGAVMRRPVVAENRRFCSRCDEPVGRGRDGAEGRTEGFCRSCGSPFSFIPKLAAGDIVAGQYEVEGCLAHGGLGWIYLARDRAVSDRWVVLKGLLNSDDEDAMAAALAERSFLAEVEHPNIVKIFNFVQHEGSGYIVMEYVGGTSLRDLLKARREANGGNANPLPVAQTIAYMVEILPALGHLHRSGLLFCDFKPDNVIQTEHSLKLIDLGGVYRIDDATSPVYGTVGYQAPEIADTGPSVASDLYTVVRTLAVLCTDFRGYQSTFRHTLPGPDTVPLYGRYDSLYKLLVRATATDPDDRFQSAEELGDQLFGVLREVVAAEEGTTVAAQSTLFTTDLRARPEAADHRLLPAPRVASDDPAAGYLASVTANDPRGRLSLLRRAPVRTVEVELQMASALIDAGDDDAAQEQLAAIAADHPWEWRVSWYRGVAELARLQPGAAREHFAGVYGAVPGELAPKLALGVAAELAGSLPEAIRWYDVVSRTDPWHTTATFGLARCGTATGDRALVLEAYDRVPEASASRVQAQTAKIRCLLDPELGGAGDVATLRAAGTALEALELDDRQLTELTAELLLRTLLLVEERELVIPDEIRVAGHPLVARDLRLGLERTYRELARYATSADERFQLVDWANRVRPRSWT